MKKKALLFISILLVVYMAVEVSAELVEFGTPPNINKIVNFSDQGDYVIFSTIQFPEDPSVGNLTIRYLPTQSFIGVNFIKGTAQLNYKGETYNGFFEATLHCSDSECPDIPSDLQGMHVQGQMILENSQNDTINALFNLFAFSGDYDFNVHGVKTYGQESRISALESWQQTITDTLSNIVESIASLLGTSSNHETRIANLESNSSGGESKNTTIPDYWKYLSSNDRKAIVCGLSKDQHLTNLTDLGWSCTTTYRNSSRGETSSCRCKRLQ